jgi:Cu+-exporting ATPase
VLEASRLQIAVLEADSAAISPGRGAACRIGSREIRAGNAAFLLEAGVSGTEPLLKQADHAGATAILVSDSGRLVGAILLRDRIREGAEEALARLRGLGLEDQRVLTGDRQQVADVIAREVGITQVESGLLPADKLERIQALCSGGAHAAMVGDGLNDAPALARAAVGIAVSGASDITAQAADVVYLPKSLEKLPDFFGVSRRAVKTAWQNIILFAFTLNAGAVLAAATGIIGPVGAAVTHQLSSFMVMMNSLRLLHVRSSRGSLFRRLWNTAISRQPMSQFITGIREAGARLEFNALLSGLIAHWPQIRRPVSYSAIALYLLSGFYMLRPDQTGVIERFGRKMLPYRKPGLHYKLPWPVDRLTRIQARRVRVVEIGFRSNAGGSSNEPLAYEWNVQHRSGRFQKVEEESLMLTGDQNMIELNATVHYIPERPDDFVFRQLDADATVRAAAESVIQGIVTSSSLDDVLILSRRDIEERARNGLERRLAQYGAGVRVQQVKLEDVHPSLEVVDAFRRVSDAFEEKNRLINEAEGYRNEQLALARGNGRALLENARAYSMGRKTRAEGDAARFEKTEQAFRGARQATESRLYLEAIEAVLPGKKKLIIDKSQGRRHLLLLQDGIELPDGIRPLAQ